MPTTWDKSTFKELSTINNNYELENGDIIQPNPINAAIENTGYLKDKLDETEEKIDNNKLYNHSINVMLIFNASSSQDTDYNRYFCDLYLQDNSATRYGFSSFTNEMLRISNQASGISCYRTCCSYAHVYNDGGNVIIERKIGVLEIYSTKFILYDLNGNVLFDNSTMSDVNRGVIDVVTLARQNS